MEIISRKEAIVVNQKWFFTGVPCKKGHIDKRSVSRWACFQCTRDYKKQQLLKNGDRIRELKRESYKRNFDSIAKKCKDKYPEIKQQRKVYLKEYYIKNRGKLLKKSSFYATTEKGKAVKNNTSNRRRSITKRGDVNTNDLLELKRNAKNCYWCNEPLEDKKINIDHYVPLSKGGKHTLSNLVVSCSKCNIEKSALDPIEFANSLGKLL